MLEPMKALLMMKAAFLRTYVDAYVGVDVDAGAYADVYLRA